MAAARNMQFIKLLFVLSVRMRHRDGRRRSELAFYQIEKTRRLGSEVEKNYDRLRLGMRGSDFNSLYYSVCGRSHTFRHSIVSHRLRGQSFIQAKTITSRKLARTSK